ncbi:MAG: type II toxin-antitoxin system VapC family toxin [Roseiarcus sp.]
MTTLLDTSVVIALINDTEPLHQWSVEELVRCKQSGPIVICDIVYCEISVAMSSVQEVDAVVKALALERLGSSDEVLFRAGKAFLKYRRDNKGPQSRILPDFLIGATAEVNGVSLVTNNRSDFVHYFPTLHVISP